MKIEHLRTVIERVDPVIIKPNCKDKRDCLGCGNIKTCSSPVSWCLLPYNGKKGCPKFGNDPDCPPRAKLFDEIYLPEKSLLIACEFDLQKYLTEMKRLHGDWSERQLRNVIYWQGQARKILKEECERVSLETGYSICSSPEAMGVDLKETMERLGIILEFPPKRTVWQIAILAPKLEA